MTDLISFFNITAPNILKSLRAKYTFVVIGGRAIKAYIKTAQDAQDWDLIVVGTPENQVEFAYDLQTSLKELGYSAHIESIEPPYSMVDNDLNIRTRTRYRIVIQMGDVSLVVYDIYQVPVFVDESIIKDGLHYSSMGFLTRELNRSEDDVKKIIRKALNITRDEIKNKYHTIETMLEDNEIDIGILSDELDDLEEDLNMQTAQKISEELDSAKHRLLKVISDREELFGAALAGTMDKSTLMDVCKMCQELESQYSKWVGLKAHCDSVKQVCN